MEELKGMSEVLVLSTAIAFVVSALIEVIKRTYTGIKKKDLNKNLIPLIAVVIGLVVGAAAYPFTSMDLVLRLWAGAISGFMASGIYETVKRTKKI